LGRQPSAISHQPSAIRDQLLHSIIEDDYQVLHFSLFRLQLKHGGSWQSLSVLSNGIELYVSSREQW
jgi:hypothetical protein